MDGAEGERDEQLSKPPQMTLEEDEMRLCLEGLSCGCTDECFFEALVQLLRSVAARRDAVEGSRGSALFPDWCDPPLPPPPWTYAPLTILDEARLIEHGVAIRVPWITPKGEAALRFLEKYGEDQEEWDEFAFTGPWPPEYWTQPVPSKERN